MSTLTQALAHANQLVDLGATEDEALQDAITAYELEGESADMLITMFDEQFYDDYNEELSATQMSELDLY